MKLRIPKVLRSFVREEHGTVITETVIIFPILIWAYVALFVYWDAYRTETTAVKASYTVADIVTRQVSDIDPAYIDNLDRLFQYLVDVDQETTIVVSSVEYQQNGDKYDVQYSEARGIGAARMTDSMMASMRSQMPRMSDGDTVIVVQTGVTYVPPFQVGVPEFTYTQFIVTRPRGPKVTCPTCALS